MVAGVVAAHVMLHAVAVQPVLQGGCGSQMLWWYDTTLFTLFLLGPSQGALLAVWFVFGGGRFLWRALILVVGTSLYVWCLLGADKEWLILSVGEMCVCGIMLLIARLAGLRLLRYLQPSLASGAFQFYIRDILMWTTVVAIALSAWKSFQAGAFSFLHDAIANIVPVFASITLVNGASVFSTLGRRWIAARILLLPAAVVAAAIWLSKTIPDPYRLNMSYYLPLLGIVAAWTAGSLLLLRSAGYRLAWRPPFADPPQEIAA